MALGRGADVRLAESVPATARALRKTGGRSRGIPILGLRSDLLEGSWQGAAGLRRAHVRKVKFCGHYWSFAFTALPSFRIGN
jgi:hypothetical protein